jgi:hypothetical protein
MSELQSKKKNSHRRTIRARIEIEGLEWTAVFTTNHSIPEKNLDNRPTNGAER